jgi:hypothetical protein
MEKINEEMYQPYGQEWKAEVLKMNKREIVDMMARMGLEKDAYAVDVAKRLNDLLAEKEEAEQAIKAREKKWLRIRQGGRETLYQISQIQSIELTYTWGEGSKTIWVVYIFTTQGRFTQEFNSKEDRNRWFEWLIKELGHHRIIKPVTV